jgi:hypothetical protein
MYGNSIMKILCIVNLLRKKKSRLVASRKGKKKERIRNECFSAHMTLHFSFQTDKDLKSLGPATQEVEIGSQLEVSLNKKFKRPHLNHLTGVVAGACDSGYKGGHR